MSVIRKHHNKNYTVMSNFHFLDKKLSLKAKGLLSLMLSLPDDWDYSTSGLENLSSDGNTSVRSALKELEEHEYLIRERVFENGRIVDWEYHIFECSKDCQVFKEQHDENTHVVDNNNKVSKQSNTKKSNKTLLSEDNNVQDFQFGKQKPKKESLYTKCINLIDAKTTDKEIRTLFINWLNMLLEKYKDRNKTLYINVFKGKLNTIDEYDKKDWKNVIEYNLQRGYEAFYPPKNFNNAYLNESGVRCVPNMTEEDYIRQEEYLREMEEKGVQVRF